MAETFKYDYKMIDQILTKIIDFSAKYSQISIITSEQFPTVSTITIAATKIQANYRGYRTRKQYAELRRHSPVKHLSQREQDEHNAAAKIQSAYRQHLAERQLHNLQQNLNGFELTHWSNTDLQS